MSEMIERVAEAMAKGEGDPVMDHWRRRASAAIEALREPTAEMIDALPKVGLLSVSDQTDYIVRDYRKMIDAALGDKP